MDGAVLRMTVDREGRICSANTRLRDLLGFSAHEWEAANLCTLVRATQGDFFADEIAETLAESRPWRGEIHFASHSGFNLWVEGELFPVSGTSGAKPDFLFVGFNISDRKLTEKALAEVEASLRIAKNA